MPAETFRPLDDQVVIEFLPLKEKSIGGVIVPDNGHAKPVYGKVLAVGPGKPIKGGRRSTPMVSAGDVVVIGRYAGLDFHGAERKELKVIRERDILAVAEGL